MAIKYRPRLRTILLSVNLLILLLPLGGIAVLRIYESALIRQTESELIAQGAFVAATYRSLFNRVADEVGYDELMLQDYGRPIADAWLQRNTGEGRWRPRPAKLDLALEEILPPQLDPISPEDSADPLALSIGGAVTPILRDAQTTTLAGIRVVDYRGIIIASTADHGALGLSLESNEEIRRALEGEPVSVLRLRVSEEPIPPLASISRGARLRIYVATPITRESRVIGAVVLSRTPVDILRALSGKRDLLLQLGAALLGFVLLLTVFTSLTISRPVDALVAQARRARRGETGAVKTLEKPVTREIALLSEEVAAMAETLELRAQYIRDFAAHVSHEFKTPLTAIQGSVELLREHADTMSDAQREKFLSNIESDSTRLSKLVQRLLALARADMMEAGDESCDPAFVLHNLQFRYSSHGHALEIRTAEKSPNVNMASEILDSILSNIVDNAIQHGGEPVGIECRISDSSMEIVISDSGSGISEANASRIFEPFFTTGREKGNTGLGLSVVRALLKAHRGDIRLLDSSVGAVFVLDLPTGM